MSTIKTEFEKFIDQFDDLPNMSQIQINTLKLAFYAGVGSTLLILNDDYIEDKDEQIKLLASWTKELQHVMGP